MIRLIGAPFDLCGKRIGSRLGPAALRIAGLGAALGALGLIWEDAGDVPSPRECTSTGGMRNFPPVLECMGFLKGTVRSALAAKTIPVVLGGEHTLAAASISAALNALNGDLAVLWIDAHADVNTPGASDTGNIHGMPVAALQGLPSETTGVQNEEWAELLELLGPERLDPKRVACYGLRDVDRSERPHMKGLPITMHEVDRHGIEPTVRRVDEWVRGTSAKNLWISFDVDALDPFLAPGTGTAVRGGLTYREAHLMAELLREALDRSDCPYRLVGIDVVETNPLYDTANATAKIAVEWVASLFGKTVLGEGVGR